MTRVRALGPTPDRADLDAWLAMRAELWPESSDGEHRAESQEVLASDRTVVLFAEQDGAVVGFCEASLRDYAEGCTTSPVGYLEGWFVTEGTRRSGVGAALVAAAEGWARERGATEFASDADLANEVSRTAHAALGFEEVERVVLYRKSL